MTHSPVTIAVDAMGGDHAPTVVLAGVEEALAIDPDVRILLVGPEEIVTTVAHERLEAVVASEVIAMHEHPANAVRTKKDSSIVVGCELVRDGRAGGFFSAGSTGACMAAATLVMRRIPGVDRPGIAAVIPAVERAVVLIDVGANADVKPEMLLQFGRMGRLYSQIVLGVSQPTVGLLNIGEEPTKGSQLAQEAHQLMAAHLEGFQGNVEGRDVPIGTVDVIVTDGFTGNVALKVLEGLAATLFVQVKDVLTESLPNRLAASIVGPSMKRLKGRLDPDVHGGAPLLGVNGVCLIGHGSSKATAIASGVAATARAIRGDLTGQIARGIASA